MGYVSKGIAAYPPEGGKVALASIAIEDLSAESLKRFALDAFAHHRQVERLGHQWVVAGARLHGERGARHRPARVHGPKARAARREARHGVADVGHRNRTKLRHDACVDLARALLYPESDHAPVVAEFAFDDR